LHQSEWTGSNNFPLERHVGNHRAAYVKICGASEHVVVQIPTEHSRVGYLLAGLKSTDASLMAAIAAVRVDNDANGMRNDFEGTATHLMPYDPVLKRRSENPGKRRSADISDVNATEATVASFGSKKGSGSSGVSFRYHTTEEYDKLNKDQRDELRTWRAANPEKKKGKGNPNPNPKNAKKGAKAQNEKAIAAAVEKRMKNAETSKKANEDGEAYVMSILQRLAVKEGTSPRQGGRVSGVSAEEPESAPVLTMSCIKAIVSRAQNDS
jgi:hypothetical protein